MTSQNADATPTPEDDAVQDHAAMQDMARAAMETARASLRPGQSLHELRGLCEDTLRELGADSFWYWGIGAFVVAGEETVLSVSGREYRTPERILGESELITVDLSPQRRGIWGDFARTLVLEDGVPLADARESSARIYLEHGNRARLDSVELFTVEPHIRPIGGRYGVKHEDIYRFVDGTLSAL